MYGKRVLLYTICCALALAALSSCSQKPNVSDFETQTEDATVNTEPVKEVEPFDPEEALSAFEISPCDASRLKLSEVDGGYAVTGYTGTDAHVRLPESVENVPVVAISERAFADNTALKTLVIPNTVKRIEAGILSGCTSLQALSTPLLGADASKSQYLGYLFGSNRFEDNPRDVPASLELLRIVGEWEKLPSYALYDCNDLVTVSLPASLRTLESFSLSRCSSLRAVDGLSGVLSIGEHALSYCTALESLSLGDGLTDIGFAALEGCDSLRTISLPFIGGTKTENRYLGYIFGAAYPDFAKDYYPVALSRVEVTAAKSLGENAFLACTGLKEVVLPEGLETVGVRAFYGCTALWSAVLPDTVQAIEASAFAGCDSLLSVKLGTSLSSLGINAFMDCDSLKTVALPQSLTALPASAFYGCSSLTEVDLGGVREVGAQAFRGCNALTLVKASGEVRFGEGNENASAVLSVGK